MTDVFLWAYFFGSDVNLTGLWGGSFTVQLISSVKEKLRSELIQATTIFSLSLFQPSQQLSIASSDPIWQNLGDPM